MAALTATFEHGVQGNKRIEYASVSGGLGSSSDTIVFPLSIITNIDGFAFTAAPGANAADPIGTISGTTVVLTGGTTGIAFVLSVQGR